MDSADVALRNRVGQVLEHPLDTVINTVRRIASHENISKLVNRFESSHVSFETAMETPTLQLVDEKDTLPSLLRIRTVLFNPPVHSEENVEKTEVPTTEHAQAVNDKVGAHDEKIKLTRRTLRSTLYNDQPPLPYILLWTTTVTSLSSSSDRALAIF